MIMKKIKTFWKEIHIIGFIKYEKFNLENIEPRSQTLLLAPLILLVIMMIGIDV